MVGERLNDIRVRCVAGNGSCGEIKTVAPAAHSDRADSVELPQGGIARGDHGNVGAHSSQALGRVLDDALPTPGNIGRIQRMSDYDAHVASLFAAPVAAPIDFRIAARTESRIESSICVNPGREISSDSSMPDGSSTALNASPWPGPSLHSTLSFNPARSSSGRAISTTSPFVRPVPLEIFIVRKPEAQFFRQQAIEGRHLRLREPA